MTGSEISISEEIVFKPQYPRRIMLTVYLYPVGVIICLVFAYMALAAGSFIPYGIYTAIFAFTTLSMPKILFREICFGENVTIKRFFLPRQVIHYEDIVELTPRMLVLVRGGLPLVNVQNRKELEKIIKKLTSRHKINLRK